MMQMEVARAQRDLDIEKLVALIAEQDAMLRQIVVSVPEEWLPAGVTLDSDNWTDMIAQDHYNEILDAMQPPQPGEKKASAGRST
jgi:hypothetical protein